MNRDQNFMRETIIRPLEYFASTLIDGVADLFGYQSVDLAPGARDGVVTLPQDLFAQGNVQTEWWYYTGHCQHGDGREFGFELVFFKRRTDLDRVGIFPLRTLANPMYFAHFAISDIAVGKMQYEHTRSFNKPLDLPVAMSETEYSLQLGAWSVREIAGKHILHATFRDGLVFDAVLEPTKPLVLNGDNGNGISLKTSGASNHFSFTRMDVKGQISNGGEISVFDGKAWMDREFGNWEQTNWDWFSIQMDDDTELMVYQFRADDGTSTAGSTGTFVARDGTCTYLSQSEFGIEVLDTWISPRTSAEYPAKWRVTVPSLSIDLSVEPVFADQELDTRGTTMIIYWEGACRVTGVSNGSKVGGRAYVELVGYDRSHENIDLSSFLFAEPVRRIKEMLS